jgi:hypothetical protein
LVLHAYVGPNGSPLILRLNNFIQQNQIVVSVITCVHTLQPPASKTKPLHHSVSGTHHTAPTGFSGGGSTAASLERFPARVACPSRTHSKTPTLAAATGVPRTHFSTATCTFSPSSTAPCPPSKSMSNPTRCSQVLVVLPLRPSAATFGSCASRLPLKATRGCKLLSCRCVPASEAFPSTFPASSSVFPPKFYRVFA